MKKNLFFILSLICLQSYQLLAQSFTTPNPNYSVNGISNTNVLSINIPVTNVGSQSIDIIIEKIVNNLAPYHSSLFCFGGANGTVGACYDTTALQSNVFSFDGNTTQPLLADLNTNLSIGQSCVTYRIKDVNNFNDFTDVEICYYVSATGINVVNALSAVSLPKPNPADKFTSITYNLKENANDYSLEIFNILGNKIRVFKLDSKNGVLLIPTSELNSGVYFYSLTEKNTILSTNKLVVSHKN